VNGKNHGKNGGADARLLLYPRVIVGRVDVGEETSRRSEPRELGPVELRHVQGRSEIAEFQPPGKNLAPNSCADVAPITREERLDTIGDSHPRAVTGRGELNQPLQHGRLEKRQVAGDNDDEGGRGGFECGVEPSHRPGSGNHIGMDREPEIGKTIRVGRDDENLRRDPLQNVHLPDDDGPAVDDEAALVASAKAARLAAGEDGGGHGLGRHD
jgi:hypothetical protein